MTERQETRWEEIDRLRREIGDRLMRLQFLVMGDPMQTVQMQCGLDPLREGKMAESPLSGIIPRLEAEIERLRAALKESVDLQSHYADLLNMYDGGLRMKFGSIDEWIQRLVQVGKLHASEQSPQVGPAAGEPVTGCIDPDAPHEQTPMGRTVGVMICPDCKGEHRWPGGALCKRCKGNGQINVR